MEKQTKGTERNFGELPDEIVLEVATFCDTGTWVNMFIGSKWLCQVTDREYLYKIRCIKYEGDMKNDILELFQKKSYKKCLKRIMTVKICYLCEKFIRETPVRCEICKRNVHSEHTLPHDPTEDSDKRICSIHSVQCNRCKKAEIVLDMHECASCNLWNCDDCVSECKTCDWKTCVNCLCVCVDCDTYECLLCSPFEECHGECNFLMCPDCHDSSSICHKCYKILENYHTTKKQLY